MIYRRLVLRSQDHSQCSSRVVQGEVLPKIDDDIDVVLGLVVFYQHLRTAALNQQQTQHVTVFTTELFAHYLPVKCLSVMQLSDAAPSQSSTYQFQSYVKCISDMQRMYTADVLLWQLLPVNVYVTRKYLRMQQFHVCGYRGNSLPELNTLELTELLQQSAVEHLTRFRQLVARSFGSLFIVVRTEFEAMYAYKRGDYQLCLQLSTQNVHMLLNANCFIGIRTYPEFILLLDDDIVSLIALTLIVNPECRDSGPTVNESSISQLTLSLYLMTQCQLKLCSSVTSLTQTLNYIKLVSRRRSVCRTFDRLTLKLSACIALRHLINLVAQ